MNKKSRWLCMILSMVLVMLLAVPVSATPGDSHAWGVYGLKVNTGYSLTALTATGNAAVAYTGQIGDKPQTVYDQVEKFTLTFSGTDEKEYVIFLLSDAGTVPSQTNIRFIDQKTGAAVVEFTVYPDTIQREGVYNLYLSTNDTYEKIGSFSVVKNWTEADYTLGDVDQNGIIDSRDSLLTLKKYAGLETLTETQILASDVDFNSIVDSRDALKILQKYAGIIDEF